MWADALLFGNYCWMNIKYNFQGTCHLGNICFYWQRDSLPVKSSLSNFDSFTVCPYTPYTLGYFFLLSVSGTLSLPRNKCYLQHLALERAKNSKWGTLQEMFSSFGHFFLVIGLFLSACYWPYFHFVSKLELKIRFGISVCFLAYQSE